MAVKTPTRTEAQTLIARIKADPAWFFAEVLGCVPYAKQIEIAHSVRDNRGTSVVGANSTGKDWAAGRILLWWMCSHYPAKVVIIGATHRQVADIVWRETRQAYLMAKTPLGGRMLDSPKWSCTDEHFALGFATDNPLNLMGFHSPNLLLIVTEAHNVDQKDIDAAMRLNPARVLMTGNALALGGEFYESFHSKAFAYHGIQITAADSPNVQQSKTVIPGLVTQENVALFAQLYGPESAMYKAAVLAEFPSTMDDAVVQRVWVDQAVRLKPDRLSTLPASLGVDVARFGADKSVAAVRDGASGRILWKVQGKDLMDVCGRIGQSVDDYKRKVELPADQPDRYVQIGSVVVDDAGLGGGVTDRLRELKTRNVIPFQAGGSAQEKDRYGNAITEAWMTLADLLRKGEFRLEPDPDLVSQLCSRRYVIQSDKRIMLEPKEQYKQRVGRSPDEADAMAMACSPIVNRGFKIWV